LEAADSLYAADVGGRTKNEEPRTKNSREAATSLIFPDRELLADLVGGDLFVAAVAERGIRGLLAAAEVGGAVFFRHKGARCKT